MWQYDRKEFKQNLDISGFFMQLLFKKHVSAAPSLFAMCA
jgi:hypothetical protein